MEQLKMEMPYGIFYNSIKRNSFLNLDLKCIFTSLIIALQTGEVG